MAQAGSSAQLADHARQSAANVRALIGQPNSLEQVRQRGAELRELGARQDHALARSRQMLKRLDVLAGVLPRRGRRYGTSAKRAGAYRTTDRIGRSLVSRRKQTSHA